MVTNIFQVDLEHFYCDYHVDVRSKEDVDEWHTYRERTVWQTEKLLDLFDRKGVTATFFVLGCVASRFPDLIERIEDSGHEIASHGYWHELATNQSPDRFTRDLEDSLELLRRHAHGKIVGYRTCNCTLVEETSWIVDILRAHGLTYDSSIFPFRTHFYGVPDAPVFPYRISSKNIKVEDLNADFLEFPLSVYRIPFLNKNIPFSGGFYFRFLPYRFTRHALRKLNKNGKPGICYIHNWEVDPDQPRIEELRGKLYHYWRLGATEKKLNRLFSDFRFVSTRDWIESNSGQV